MNESPLGSTVPTLEKVQFTATHVGVSITGVGATLPAGSPIVTIRVAVSKSPHQSVTVSVTV